MDVLTSKADAEDAPMQLAGQQLPNAEVLALDDEEPVLRAPEVEPWEAERQEKARCWQQAVRFLKEPGWVEDLLLLCGALQPQVAFMRMLLHSCNNGIIFSRPASVTSHCSS